MSPSQLPSAHSRRCFQPSLVLSKLQSHFNEPSRKEPKDDPRRKVYNFGRQDTSTSMAGGVTDRGPGRGSRHRQPPSLSASTGPFETSHTAPVFDYLGASRFQTLKPILFVAVIVTSARSLRILETARCLKRYKAATACPNLKAACAVLRP